ncbi:MAG: hypothetical protein HETSPECPRED_003456 [Heterodermia speciosa]|uniref:Glucose-methanol-choline oxidoreductase N-terminal domain-containing protein n=1 Tax=Heterodermia speciosa TaxID=116794 RepID=A0A8H3I5M8_9LECA|nr:MAG: hypothetical protein HETSPECPRED_003456 [Heterodermia speciosa]
MSTFAADYVVVGGGLTGCTIASRLKQHDPATSVVVLEAGPNPESKHDVITPMGGFALQGTELDWQYSTTPQNGTHNRTHTLTAGKTLGGGSVLNYGGWSRGDAADYDAWSRITGFGLWDYESLSPYFKRSERFDPAVNAQPGALQRGLWAPVKITSVSASSPKRKYPLKEPILAAWRELGVERTTYGCTGRNEGVSEWLENWDNGRRQPAHEAYSLDGVRIMSNIPVSKVIFAETNDATSTQRPKAAGVLLQNGQKIQASREVLICAGALRSPTILMASGIGPRSLLNDRQIPLVQELPGVGANMIDHFALFQLFKLRPSNTGLALGHPDLDDPAMLLGLPTDFAVNEGLPRDLLEKALDKDGVTGTERDSLLEPGRCFLEFLVFYHPMHPAVPADGTHVSTSVMLTLPSSRGSVTLPKNPEDPPVINPGYFTTALDRLALIHGVRRMLQLMLGTKAMQSYVEAEVPPPSLPTLDPSSSDSEIENRIRAAGVAHFHSMGTCALGAVLDEEMRVRGVEGLRVCDASAVPSPVGGHPQGTLYGIGERAAEMIVGETA